MVDLEFAEATTAPNAIENVGHLFLHTDFDGLGNHGVVRRLVTVRHLGNDLHETGAALIVNQLDEPDQLISKIGTNELSSIKECDMDSPQGLQILFVMPEPHPLPDRCLVINLL